MSLTLSVGPRKVPRDNNSTTLMTATKTTQLTNNMRIPEKSLTTEHSTLHMKDQGDINNNKTVRNR